MSDWANRIIGEGEENPEQLLANPDNWRIHPKLQQDVLADVLDEVGWVQRVIVNTTTGHMIDGHLRAQLAISREEQSVPVTYVELTLDEERKILATLDPIAGLAASDDEKLKELLDVVDSDAEALRAWLSEQQDDLAAAGQERKDGVWDGDGYSDTLDRYAAKGTRYLLLDYPLAVFDWVTERMVELRDARGASSNAAVFLAMLVEETGQQPPAVEVGEAETAAE